MGPTILDLPYRRFGARAVTGLTPPVIAKGHLAFSEQQSEHIREEIRERSTVQ
jgi:hypothetical protein